MKVGNTIRVRIEKVVYGGDGLARPEGRVLFVPGVIPGEAVAVEITRDKRDFARGRVAEILEPSPHRIEPQCRYFGVCPGCSYCHVAFAGECKLKNRQLREFLNTLPETDAEEVMEEYAIPEHEYFYRNKIVLHTAKSGGDPRLGYFGSDNTSVTDIPECLLARPEINAELARLRGEPGFFHSLHDRMALTLRYTESDGVVHWRNSPERDAPVLTEKLPDGDFSVPRGSFFQVNMEGALNLWNLVGGYLKNRSVNRFIDAYSGSGFFACAALAAGVERVTGVESDPDAVAIARRNLVRRGGDPDAIACADAGLWLPEHLTQAEDDCAVLVDPPRTGLSGRARNAIAASAVRRLIYVSCDPATLLRDLRELGKAGFRLTRAQLVNMFPRTGHFEVFTTLERQ